MKITSSIIQWAIVIAVTYFILMGFSFRPHVPVFPVVPGYLVVPFALSLAFIWVEVLKLGSVKPFTCVKCLSAWFALILSLVFHQVAFCFFHMALGLFAGSMYSAVKMRFL